MKNNSNPHDIDGGQVRNKSYDLDVVRARVLDVLPEIHAVRVNPRGDDAPFIAPVLTPNYGSSTLPQKDSRVSVLYITDNTAVVLGSVYLLDGEDPPTVAEDEIRFGNSSGSYISINQDGSISIRTEGNKPVNIDHQSATAIMSADQSIAGDDQYYIVDFDDVNDDPDDLFDPNKNGFVIKTEGQHNLSSTVEVTSAGQNNRYTLALYRNGQLMKRKSRQSAVNDVLSITVTTNRQFEDGDVIDVRFRQDSGTSKIINSNFNATEFYIQRKGI